MDLIKSHIAEIGFSGWLQVGRVKINGFRTPKCFGIVNEFMILSWGFELNKNKKPIYNNKAMIFCTNKNSGESFHTDLMKFKFAKSLGIIPIN